MTVLNAAQSATVDLLADGSADAAFLGGAVPTASITQAATSMDLVFVPFDEAARQALIRDYPFFEPATIPAGVYKGLDQELAALDVGSMHLIAAAATDEELVYSVTKALWEGRAQVVERHPAGRAIREGNVTRDTGTPFHPGAERFYRELGIWPAAEEPAAEPGAAQPEPAEPSASAA
jgi:TRAP transporter TAXI family solute receptor